MGTAMSDREGSWKPNGRPQSTIARNFSAALNDAFSIDSNLDRNLKGLVQSVEQKKQTVDSQNQELEALEARLRDTEERLRQQQLRKSSHTAKTSAINSPHRRQPLRPTFSGQRDDRSDDTATSSLAAQPPRTQPSTSRASSYQMPPMPGALPPTPGVTSGQDSYN